MILCLPAAHASIFNTPHQAFLNQCVKLFLCHSSGLPKWGRLVEGDNLGKMVKNCMKITKSLFRGKQGGGVMGGQANFSGSGEIPPPQSPLPTMGNSVRKFLPANVFGNVLFDSLSFMLFNCVV